MNFRAFSEMVFIKLTTTAIPALISTKTILFRGTTTAHRGGKLQQLKWTQTGCGNHGGHVVEESLDSRVACRAQASLLCPHHTTSTPGFNANSMLIQREHEPGFLVHGSGLVS